MDKPMFMEQPSGKDPPLQWQISRRGRGGEPTSTITVIAGVRLQVYRHVAHPKAWTAYARSFLSDVVLTAEELEAAKCEALALLQDARAQPIR